MRLKEIVINGFKSFPQRTTVKINSELTAVVGPNGSGKSNISDAFKWVMGEQSAKILRGSKMEDVIFAGTEKRKPLSYAQVDLIFDNSSKKLPIEYKEVCITRKLYRNGESEYLLNNSQIKLKEIRELFMDTGIGIDGYSIIGQGRVEDIISAKSETRRKIIEEAAGIVKFKARKEEAQKNLQKTDDNIARVNDIIGEIENRIEPLKKQNESAEKYLLYKQELKKHELNLFAREYEKQNEQLNLLKNHDESKEYEIYVKEEEIIINQSKHDLLIEKVKKIEENKALEEERLSSKNNMFLENESKIKLDDEREKIFIREKEKVHNTLNSARNRQRFLNEEVIKLTEIKEEKRESFIKTQKNLNLEIKKLDDYSNSKHNVQNIIEIKKNDVFELYSQKTNLKGRMNTIDSLIENSENRIRVFEENLYNYNDSEKEINRYLNELDKKIEENKVLKIDFESKIEELINNSNEYKDRHKEISFKTTEFANKINEYSSRKNILNKMQDNYEGYFRSIQQFMIENQKRGLFKSEILGIVAEIISAEKIYETALEIALGSAMQNIIIDEEKNASKIINYLKSKNIGRITFLPIDTIRGRYLNEVEKRALSIEGCIGVLNDIVKFDNKFKSIVDFLLGRTIVADNVENGIKIAKAINYSTRIVTLDGEIINAGGSITGGSIKKSAINLIGRSREIQEIEKNITIYESKHAEEKDKAEAFLKAIYEIENKLIEVKEKKEIIVSEIRDEESLIKIKKEELKNVLTNRDKIDEDISFLTKEKEKYLNEKIELFTELKNTEEKVKELEIELEKSSLDYKESQENLEVIKNNATDFRIELSNLNNQLDNVAIQIEMKEEEIDKLSKIIDEETILLNDIIEKISVNNQEKAEAIKENEKILEETNLIKEEIKKVNDNRKQTQDELLECQKNLNILNRDLSELNIEKNSIKAKIESIENKLELISNSLWDEYEMSYAMCLEYKEESISITKLSNDVRMLKSKIKSLGDVNINSIDEYKEVSQRYEFLTKQRDDLESAKKKLNKVIKDLTFEMKLQFDEQFAKIRDQFIEVFVNLFNGGKADIVLLDEEDSLNSDIEIYVQPPGKRLNKISLLSGGEKTLTAIALLFAILKTNPTPFCILDEIEAALDDANVHRFARYLKEFSKETQFLVITHRKGTMEYVDTIYGATMEEHGITKLVSLKLSDYKN